MMTTTERVQLEKDILYEHHKADGEFSAQLVKLRQSQRELQHAADKLKIFLDYAESGQPLRRDGAPIASLPDIDLKQIEVASRELVALREKVDQLQADKKGLGL
jgi:hypothetical protein